MNLSDKCRIQTFLLNVYNALLPPQRSVVFHCAKIAADTLEVRRAATERSLWEK